MLTQLTTADCTISSFTFSVYNLCELCLSSRLTSLSHNRPHPLAAPPPDTRSPHRSRRRLGSFLSQLTKTRAHTHILQDGSTTTEWRASSGVNTAMQIQDGQDFGCRKLLGSQRVCAHRYRAILCREGYQQEAHGWSRTHGQE